MAIEEHGGGKQLARFRTWPRCSLGGLVITSVFALLAVGAALDRIWVVFAILAVVTAVLVLRMLWECAAAVGAFLYVLDKSDDVDLSSPDGHSRPEMREDDG
jgi:hypothetical protein